jgi:hypothetical protein
VDHAGRAPPVDGGKQAVNSTHEQDSFGAKWGTMLLRTTLSSFI